MKRKRLILIGLVLLLVGGGLTYWLLPDNESDQSKKEPKHNPVIGFTISEETTYVTGPLAWDGRIDYATALNEKLGRGITPENNANVQLVNAIGPMPRNAGTARDAYYAIQGMEKPPEMGDYYICHAQFPARSSLFDEQLKLAPHRPWTAKEFPDIAPWLKTNEKSLRLIEAATRRPYYFSPVVPPASPRHRSTILNAPLPYVDVCREIPTFLTARAMFKLGQNDIDGAWADLLTGHRLARLLCQGATLVEVLEGCNIEKIIFSADFAFLEHIREDKKRLENCVRDLRALGALPEPAKQVELGDRFMYLDIIMMIDRYGLDFLEDMTGEGKGKGNRDNELAKLLTKELDWDPALRRANSYYPKMARIMREKNRSLRAIEWAEFTEELLQLRAEAQNGKDVPAQVVQGESMKTALGKKVGDILISLLMPAGQKVQDAADRTQQLQDNLLVAFALARYRLDHGSNPKELEALAPKYLDKVPIDIFSGEKLIYKPDENGYQLYSVGVNGKYDEGSTADDDPPGDDLVVTMPARVPKKE